MSFSHPPPKANKFSLNSPGFPNIHSHSSACPLLPTKRTPTTPHPPSLSLSYPKPPIPYRTFVSSLPPPLLSSHQTPKANRSPSIHRDFPTSFNSHPLRLPSSAYETYSDHSSLSRSLAATNEMAERPQSFYSVNPLLGPLPTCATNSIPPKAHLHFLSFSLAIRQWGVTTTPEN